MAEEPQQVTTKEPKGEVAQVQQIMKESQGEPQRVTTKT